MFKLNGPCEGYAFGTEKVLFKYLHIYCLFFIVYIWFVMLIREQCQGQIKTGQYLAI